MPPLTTRAHVLKALPYRESSYILNVFSENHGLIHIVAKGLRKSGKGQVFVERGYKIEFQLYAKPNRDLHTAGAMQVLEFYPQTRADLIKTAVRDAAIEMVLGAITVEDPHPEMSQFVERFFMQLEQRPSSMAYPLTLWRFYARFAAMMGFELDMGRCISCGEEFGEGDAFLRIGQGGLECEQCSKARAHDVLVPATVRLALSVRSSTAALGALNNLSPPEQRRITHLLADFCRYHFENQHEYKALVFLDQVIGGVA